MANEFSPVIRAVPGLAPDPASRLLADLPAEWRGEVIGDGIGDWAAHIPKNKGKGCVDLSGVPERLRVELAWMAHWQYRDGVIISYFTYSQLAAALAWQSHRRRPVPESLVDVDLDTMLRLHSTWFEATHGRLPAIHAHARVRRSLGYPRLALIARLHNGPWWEMDFWLPRCDPRIPVREREPKADNGCFVGEMNIPWVRDAGKWVFGNLLTSGALTWSTVRQRVHSLLRFSRWMETLEDPVAVGRDLSQAPGLAFGFREWVAEPGNRSTTRDVRPAKGREVNNDLRAVVQMMEFLIDNREAAHKELGPSPWDDLTASHLGIWERQRSRQRAFKGVNEEHYIDDHATAQIMACLTALGAPLGKNVVVNVNGSVKAVEGQGDPQVMRMLLLQILTGRRVSEICLCDFDCLSPATDRAIEAAEGEEVARFRYGQSKIECAPDTILVDSEVVSIIKEQQQWVREKFPDAQPRYLFLARMANARGTKNLTSGAYAYTLKKFSSAAQVVDSAGRPVSLTRTHRFRHSRITRLAELGLPIHVIQRYAGHTTATMTMHYVAQREEHAEQAFLATRKFKADGGEVKFSQDDHDVIHLFNRSDRILTNGYCGLPPLQTCDKGNACLSCGVFITDETYRDDHEEQLAKTVELIKVKKEQFQKRTGRDMPDDNIWLVGRTQERDRLTNLLKKIDENPGRAVQGPGCTTAFVALDSIGRGGSRA